MWGVLRWGWSGCIFLFVWCSVVWGSVVWAFFFGFGDGCSCILSYGSDGSLVDVYLRGALFVYVAPVGDGGSSFLFSLVVGFVFLGTFLVLFVVLGRIVVVFYSFVWGVF